MLSPQRDCDAHRIDGRRSSRYGCVAVETAASIVASHWRSGGERSCTIDERDVSLTVWAQCVPGAESRTTCSSLCIDGPHSSRAHRHTRLSGRSGNEVSSLVLSSHCSPTHISPPTMTRLRTGSAPRWTPRSRRVSDAAQCGHDSARPTTAPLWIVGGRHFAARIDPRDLSASPACCDRASRSVTSSCAPHRVATESSPQHVDVLGAAHARTLRRLTVA